MSGPSRGVGLTARVLGVDARRGGALVLAAVLAAAGTAYLLQRVTWLGTEVWPPTWAAAVTWSARTGIVLGPVAAGVGAWVGGRERRLRVGELVAVTPRPPWQRVSATWGVLAACVALGFLAQVAVALAGVVAGGAYAGGREPVSLAVVTLGVLAASALGLVAGRLVPSRLVAPAAALVVLLGAWFFRSSLTPWPVGVIAVDDGTRLRTVVLVAFVVQLLAGVAACLVLAGARRRPWTLVPAAVAAVATVSLLVAPSWTEPDPGARALVCTTDGGLPVCVQQVHAESLDAVAAVVRERTASVADLVRWDSAREVPATDDALPPPGVLALPDLSRQQQGFGLGPARPGELREAVLAGALSTTSCGIGERAPWLETDVAVAASLLGVPGYEPLEAAPAADHEAITARLREDPAAARAWTARWVAAAPVCDRAALQELARP